MTFAACRPLASLAALIVYLTVNVGAAALHHHRGPAAAPADAVAGAVRTSQLDASDPAGDDDDEHCPLCAALRLSPALPAPTLVALAVPALDDAFGAVPIHCPSPLASRAHARSPPGA